MYFTTINAFGVPILYPILAVILLLLSTILFIISLFRVMKHKEVLS
ncbi:hypothetical protein WAK64_14820 [Bacillus spongiae]|uniref:DUF3955 domain-containing protein n=1 Tax=Bacillus spongiae TaxID=2683610 RepID=A0ABU8HG26_9BACI